MPRPRLAARLYQRPSSPDWIIRDGSKDVRTGLSGESDRGAAEEALAAYLNERGAVVGGPRQPSQVLISEILARYLEERGPLVADGKRMAHAAQQMLPFWGSLTADAVRGANCRIYAKRRGVASPTVRRELGVLQAALNHAVAEGRLTHAPQTTLPDHAPPRERWLTRDEAAKLLCEIRRTPQARHVARLLLMGLYSGTRPGTILRTRWERWPDNSGPWLDLDRGIYHRAGAAEKQTKKRRSSCKIPGRLLAHLRRWRRTGGVYVVQRGGKPISDAGKALDGCAARAGIERLTMHTLKHTSVSWYFQAGGNLEDGAAFFATTAATLERVYNAHAPEYQAEQARVVGQGGRRR